MPRLVELGCLLLHERYGQAAKESCLQGTVPLKHLRTLAKQSPYQQHARTQAAGPQSPGPQPPGTQAAGTQAACAHAADTHAADAHAAGSQTVGSARMTCHYHGTGCASPEGAAAAEETGLRASLSWLHLRMYSS